MVTLATSTPSKPKTANRESVHGFPGENLLHDLQFRLTHNLQCSLDLHTTLELFFNNLQDAVSVAGMEYQSAEAGFSLQLGNRRAHTASYTLSVGENSLGSLCFSRGKRFAERELKALEMLMGVLYFPLRNALLYRQALENSQRDPLTGIGNRAALDASFDREIKLARRHQQQLSLLIIDIDHFKQVNDTYGHQAGDRVIRRIASSLRSAVRETDQVFRYGGEEFVILLNNTGADDAKLTAERIRLQIAMSPVLIEPTELMASISIGVSELVNTDEDGSSLFERADKALYLAKSTGRNRVILG